MKILVVNFLYIGDLLFATPFLRALHECYPEAQLDVLIDRPYRELMAYHPLLSDIIAVEKKQLNGLRQLLPLIMDIRRRRYDMVINLHESEVPTIITICSGAPQRHGIGVRFFKRFFTSFSKERTDVHQVQAYLDVLRDMGQEPLANHGLELHVDEASQRAADSIWQQAGLLDCPRVIGINTGGSWPSKRWTVEGFAAFADLLQQEGYRPVFFGGTADIPMVEAICALMSTPPVLFTGKLTLLELAALCGKCAAFVSGDSGPLHVAVSQQVPAVAIFGPSDPVRYAPFGPHRLVRANEPCLACRQHECAHHRCMRNVSPEQVYAALLDLLKQNTFRQD